MARTLKIRYFAAAADAAGTDEQVLQIENSLTIAELTQHVGEEHGAEFARVVEICSFLVDGRAADAGEKISAAEEIPLNLDVLPPFAGG